MKAKKLIKKIQIFNTIIIFILSVITIYQTNSLVGQITLKKELEKRVEKVMKENQELEDVFLSFSSPKKIDEFLENENLVKAKNIKFLQIFSSAALAK